MSRTVNSVRVMVDPKVELMSVAQHIGGFREHHPSLLTRQSFSYRQDVEKAFAAHRNHPAVAMVADLSTRGFTFSRPPFIMLHLGDDFALSREIVPDAFAVKLSGGEEQVRALGREMARFCQDTDFGAFYERHRSYYAKLVDQVAQRLVGRNYVQQIESFYGVHQRGYTLVLVSLYGPVGYGPNIERQDGGREVFNILGPHGLTEGLPDFGHDSFYFDHMQRHEFSHSFVNPLASRYQAQVARLAPIFQQMPKAQNICGEWEECLNEQVVRAVTTYFAYGDSEGAGRGALATERGRGAILIDELLAGVREYAAARDRYPTFESYYPVLLHRLDPLLKQPPKAPVSESRTPGPTR